MDIRSGSRQFLIAFTTAALVGLLANPAMAAKADCNAQSCTDELGRIYVTSKDGKPHVYVSIEDRSLAKKTLKCKLVSDRYFTLDGDHPAFDEIFLLLVETKKGITDDERNRITIRIVDNSPVCEIAYVVVEWPNNPSRGFDE